MKKLCAVLALIASTGMTENAAAADKYIFDKSHTNVVWHADHFGFSSPNGQFARADGFVMLDKENPVNSKVEATIDTTSLWTLDGKFTEHLIGEDFLNIHVFPSAKFVSTKVEKIDDKSAKVTGDLTLLGVTKPIVLDVKLNAIGKHPYTQRETAGFSVSTKFKRSDFGMTYGIPGISDEVRVDVEIETMLESAPDAAKK